LARLGFTQSYSYFTWRTTKQELTEFALMHAERCDEARPNLFVNTPDILHESLQHGGRAIFAIRAALASTMAPTWGVYSGFELYEGEAVKPGSEEYLNSEKYELRPRDYAAENAAGNSLEPYVTRLNEIRRGHPALQQLRNIAFHHCDNEQIIVYSKTDPATGDTVLVVINLDPWNAQVGNTALDLPELGFDWGDTFTVHDEITGGTWQWGQFNYVALQPWDHVAHIFAVRP
jgi:starch synthase (maltosyl-transferring)